MTASSGGGATHFERLGLFDPGDDVAPTNTLLVSDAVRAALAPADDLRVGPGADSRLNGFAESLAAHEVARVEPTAGVAGHATL